MNIPAVVAVGDQGNAARADTRRLIARIRDIDPHLWLLPSPHGPWAAAVLATAEPQPGRRNALCRSIAAAPIQPTVMPGPRVRVCGDCYLDALTRLGAPSPHCAQCRRPPDPGRPTRTVIAQAGWTLAAATLCATCLTAEHWQAPT